MAIPSTLAPVQETEDLFSDPNQDVLKYPEWKTIYSREGTSTEVDLPHYLDYYRFELFKNNSLTREKEQDIQSYFADWYTGGEAVSDEEYQNIAAQSTAFAPNEKRNAQQVARVFGEDVAQNFSNFDEPTQTDYLNRAREALLASGDLAFATIMRDGRGIVKSGNYATQGITAERQFASGNDALDSFNNGDVDPRDMWQVTEGLAPSNISGKTIFQSSMDEKYLGVIQDELYKESKQKNTPIQDAIISSIKTDEFDPDLWKSPVKWFKEFFEEEPDKISQVVIDKVPPEMSEIQDVLVQRFSDSLGLTDAQSFGLNLENSNRYSAERINGFLKELATRHANEMGMFKLHDAERDFNNVRLTEMGNVIVHPTIMKNPTRFKEVIEKDKRLSDQQKFLAKRDRDFFILQQAPQFDKLMEEFDGEVGDKWVKAKTENPEAWSKNRVEFLDKFLSDKTNYDHSKNYWAGVGSSVPDALFGLVNSVGALFGLEFSANYLAEYHTKQQNRRELAGLFGENLGFSYDALTTAPAVVADLAATALVIPKTAKVLSLAKGVMSPRNGFKAMTSRMLLREAGEKATLTANRKAAQTAITESTKTGAEAYNAISSFNKLVGSKLNVGTAVFLTSANRSAGGMYATIYSSMPEDMSHEEKHDKALGHALLGGLITGVVTSGFTAIGAGGIENVFTRGLSFSAAKRVLDKIGDPGFLTDEGLKRLLKKHISSQTKKLFFEKGAGLVTRVGVSALQEGVEEGIDQWAQSFVEDSALQRNTPMRDRVMHTVHAFKLGAVMGAGVNVIAPAGGSVWKRMQKTMGREKALEEDETIFLFEQVQKAADVLERADSPQSAARLRELVFEKFTKELASKESPLPRTEVATEEEEELEIKFPEEETAIPLSDKQRGEHAATVAVANTSLNEDSDVDIDSLPVLNPDSLEFAKAVNDPNYNIDPDGTIRGVVDPKTDEWVGAKPAETAEEEAEEATEEEAEEAFADVAAEAPTTAPASSVEAEILVPYEGVDGAGEAPVVNLLNRLVVFRSVNGVVVPFYLSTGAGGKKTVAAGKWYPFFGVADSGQLNKGSQKEINNHYGSPALKKAAEALDAELGKLDPAGIPKIRARGGLQEAIEKNLGVKPVQDKTSLDAKATDRERRKRLVENVTAVVSRIEQGATPTTLESQAGKVDELPKGLSSADYTDPSRIKDAVSLWLNINKGAIFKRFRTLGIEVKIDPEFGHTNPETGELTKLPAGVEVITEGEDQNKIVFWVNPDKLASDLTREKDDTRASAFDALMAHELAHIAEASYLKSKWKKSNSAVDFHQYYLRERTKIYDSLKDKHSGILRASVATYLRMDEAAVVLPGEEDSSGKKATMEKEQIISEVVRFAMDAKRRGKLQEQAFKGMTLSSKLYLYIEGILDFINKNLLNKDLGTNNAKELREHVKSVGEELSKYYTARNLTKSLSQKIDRLAKIEKEEKALQKEAEKAEKKKGEWVANEDKTLHDSPEIDGVRRDQIKKEGEEWQLIIDGATQEKTYDSLDAAKGDYSDVLEVIANPIPDSTIPATDADQAYLDAHELRNREINNVSAAAQRRRQAQSTEMATQLLLASGQLTENQVGILREYHNALLELRQITNAKANPDEQIKKVKEIISKGRSWTAWKKDALIFKVGPKGGITNFKEDFDAYAKGFLVAAIREKKIEGKPEITVTDRDHPVVPSKRFTKPTKRLVVGMAPSENADVPVEDTAAQPVDEATQEPMLEVPVMPVHLDVSLLEDMKVYSGASISEQESVVQDKAHFIKALSEEHFNIEVTTDRQGDEDSSYRDHDAVRFQNIDGNLTAVVNPLGVAKLVDGKAEADSDATIAFHFITKLHQHKILEQLSQQELDSVGQLGSEELMRVGRELLPRQVSSKLDGALDNTNTTVKFILGDIVTKVSDDTLTLDDISLIESNPELATLTTDVLTKLYLETKKTISGFPNLDANESSLAVTNKGFNYLAANLSQLARTINDLNSRHGIPYQSQTQKLLDPNDVDISGDAIIDALEEQSKPSSLMLFAQSPDTATEEQEALIDEETKKEIENIEALLELGIWESGEYKAPGKGQPGFVQKLRQLFEGTADPNLRRIKQHNEGFFQYINKVMGDWSRISERLINEAYGSFEQARAVGGAQDIMDASGSTEGYTLKDSFINKLNKQYEETRKAVERDIKDDPKLKAAYIKRARQLRQKRIDDEIESQKNEIKRRRLAALSRIRQRSPELYQHLINMRGLVDTMSKKIRDGLGLNEKLKIKFTKQLEVYLTRSYRIFSQPGWKEMILTSDHSDVVQAREAAKLEYAKLWKQKKREELFDKYSKNRPEGSEELSSDDLWQQATDEAEKQFNIKVSERAARGEDFADSLMREQLDKYELGATDVLHRKDNIPAPIRKILGEYGGETGDFNLMRTFLNVSSLAAKQSLASNIISAGRTGEGTANEDRSQWWFFTQKERDEMNDSSSQFYNPELYAKLSTWGYVNSVDKNMAGPSEFNPFLNFIKDGENQGTLIASPEVQNELRAMFVKQSEHDPVRKLTEKLDTGFRKAVGWSLMSKTIGSGPFYSRNIVSNLAFFSLAQGMAPTGVTKLFSELNRLFIQNNKPKAMDAYIHRLVGYRILDNDFTVGMMEDILAGKTTPESLLAETNQAIDDAMEKQGIPKVDYATSFSALRSKLEKVGDLAELTVGDPVISRLKNLSIACDSFYKIAYFEKELKTLRDAREEDQKKNKDTLMANATDNKLERLAADKVLMTAQSWSQAMNFGKAFQNSALGVTLAPYLRFKLEVVRIVANTYKLGTQEVRSGNSVLVRRGMRRLAGMTTALTSFSVLAKTLGQWSVNLIAELLGHEEADDLTDEMKETLLAGVPPFLKTHTFYYTRDKEGNLISWDLTYLNPFAMYTDALPQFWSHATAGRMGDAFGAVFKTAVAVPFMEGQILTSAVGSVARNKDSRDNPIWLETDNFLERTIKQIGYVYQQAYEPPTLARLGGIRLGYTQEEGFDLRVLDKLFASIEAGREGDWFNSPLGLMMGEVMFVKGHRVDPQNTAFRIMQGLAKDKDSIRSMINRLASDRLMSEEQIESLTNQYINVQMRLAKRAMKHWQPLLDLGVDPEWQLNALNRQFGADNVESMVFDGQLNIKGLSDYIQDLIAQNPKEDVRERLLQFERLFYEKTEGGTLNLP